MKDKIIIAFVNLRNGASAYPDGPEFTRWEDAEAYIKERFPDYMSYGLTAIRQR